MSDIALSFSDEDLEQSREGVQMLTQMILAGKHILDNSDSYTKEEIVEIMQPILEILSMSLDAGTTIIEGTVEIHRMTAPPADQQ